MARKPRGPVGDPPPRLRQRLRADGTWRIWWEPEQKVRKLGFATVELDADTPVKAAREARKLNAAVDQARITGQAPVSRRGLICIEDAATDYQKSLRFTRLATTTQNGYRSFLKTIIAKWGAEPVRDFTKPMADLWYETLYREKGPAAALALIRMLSVLMGHAERRGWRPEGSNPCTELGVTIPKGRARSAEWREYDALQAAAVRVGLHSIGLAVALSMLAGQRQTDVITALRGDFGPRMVRFPGATKSVQVWIWTLTRSKTGASGTIMLHQELAPMVKAVLDQPGEADGTLILDEISGEAYNLDTFQHRWAKVRAAAIAGGTQADGTIWQPCRSLASLQFRDLRRSFAVHSRRGGASVNDAGDALGNSAAVNFRIKGTYMPPEFFTAARAVSAVARPTPEKTEERKKA